MTPSRIFLTLLLALAISLPALAAPPGGGRGGAGYRGGGGGGGASYRGGGGRHYGGKHHHGHGGSKWVVGVNVGYGWGWPYFGFSPWAYPYYPYYPYAYYPAYYPAPVAVQQQPTTYIEQPEPQAQQQAATGYWYYCADPGAYYPYIKECPAGWQRVAPQPGN